MEGYSMYWRNPCREKVDCLVRWSGFGRARVAHFYSSLSAPIEAVMGAGSIAKVYGSIGSMESGEKSIPLEDVEGGIQAGYLFGPGSPHNWSRDLDGYEARAGIDAAGLSSVAFTAMARLHRQHWNDAALASTAWLRGSAWHGGADRENWEAAQAYAASSWADAIKDSAVVWDPFVLDVVNASLARASWAEYQVERQGSAFTLVHGDFHPANMLWVPATRRLVILDWEVVGVGSGPQDCAQFLISHASPPARRACEVRLMREYYSVLVEAGSKVKKAQYSWEQCWADYVHGGASRWVWLLAVLASTCPSTMVQFFHDQTAAFLRDHGVTVATVGMPRV